MLSSLSLENWSWHLPRSATETSLDLVAAVTLGAEPEGACPKALESKWKKEELVLGQ